MTRVDAGILDMDVFDTQKHIHCFGCKHQNAVNQGLVQSGGSHEGLIPFLILFDMFVAQSLHIVMCHLYTDGLFGFALKPRIGSCSPRAGMSATRQDKIQGDLFNTAQFYMIYRLNLHRQLNTVQLRNKRKNVTIKK